MKGRRASWRDACQMFPHPRSGPPRPAAPSSPGCSKVRAKHERRVTMTTSFSAVQRTASAPAGTAGAALGTRRASRCARASYRAVDRRPPVCDGRLVDGGELSDESIRIGLWADGLRLWHEAPVLGSGTGDIRVRQSGRPDNPLRAGLPFRQPAPAQCVDRVRQHARDLDVDSPHDVEDWGCRATTTTIATPRR